jgi:hypothetical protein
MIRVLVAALAGVLLTLAFLASVGYSPPNALADGPGRDSDSALLRAAVAGCAEGLGAAVTRIQGGVYESRCTPNLGVGPAVKRRAR